MKIMRRVFIVTKWNNQQQRCVLMPDAAVSVDTGEVFARFNGEVKESHPINDSVLR